MTARVTRIERLRELQRRLEAVRDLIEEIERTKLLAKLQAEERVRWDRVALCLRLTALPHSTGGVTSLLVALHDSLDAT